MFEKGDSLAIIEFYQNIASTMHPNLKEIYTAQLSLNGINMENEYVGLKRENGGGRGLDP